MTTRLICLAPSLSGGWGRDGGVSVGGVTTSACCGAVSGYRGDKKAAATCNRPMGKHHRKTVEMSLTRMDGVMMEMCTSTRVFCSLKSTRSVVIWFFNGDNLIGI